jgi:hypothetical protein
MPECLQLAFHSGQIVDPVPDQEHLIKIKLNFILEDYSLQINCKGKHMGYTPVITQDSALT